MVELASHLEEVPLQRWNSDALREKDNKKDHWRVAFGQMMHYRKRQRSAGKIRGATILAALVLATPNATANDSIRKGRSRHESIDELGEHYFDVSDWTSSNGDREEQTKSTSSYIARNELAKQAELFGIKRGEWTWPYPLSKHDAKVLSYDERRYIEQELGIAMPSSEKGVTQKGLVSKSGDDDDAFVVLDSLDLATQRQRHRRLMSAEEPMAYVDERKLRSSKTGESDGIGFRADPRRRRRNDQQLNLVSDDNNPSESADRNASDASTQGINTHRCIDDSLNNAVPCPPDNMGPTCDKYNPDGSFRQCYEMCKPSFCCIHDSQSQTLSPSCAQTEPNCESYFACYIIWWRLHNTIGPATFLRVPQSDDAFYDMTYDEVIGDLAADEGFRNQMFNHHFDTDTVPTDADFENPNNW